MKIPLYRRQTQMTRDSGARPLSAFASPSDYAAPANAAVELGGAIAGAGRALGDIAVTEAKQENATLQAAEEAKFADFVFKTQQEALTGPVGQSQKVPANPNLPSDYPNALRLMVDGPAETQQQHVSRVQRSLANEISRQAARIPDRDVRRRFTASAQATMRSALPGLSATYRTRYLDRHRATMNQSDVSMRRHVGTLKGLPRQQQINKHVDRIRQDGANQFETEVNINARVQKFLSGTDQDLVRQEIVSIERMDDSQQERAYDNLFIRLNDNAQFRNLEQDDRIKLQKFVANQSERAGTSYANRISTETARNEKVRKDTQLATYESLQKRILDYRQYVLSDGQGTPVNPVTEADISGLRSVTKPMRDSLRKMMRGEDTIYNPKLYKDLLDQVDEAVTDEDLEAIREDVTDYNLDGQLGGLAAQEIRKQIDGLKTKTPDALERKRYRNALKQALGANATRFQSSRTDETLREAEIINFYNDQLQRGVLPGVAYVNAIERGKAKTIENVTALVQSLPPQLYNLFSFGTQNKIQLPGDDETDLRKKKQKNDEFISDTQTKMLRYLRNQISGIEAKYDLEIDGALPTPEDAIPSDRMTPQQLGEQQRLKDKEKRLTKKDRMTVRQLFTLERRIEQIITTLKKAADDGYVDPRNLDGGGDNSQSPNENRGN
tara:strand:- start:771 stop:2771 length:2001 start_codon:yes stop_codon:yes gene_type:complete